MRILLSPLFFCQKFCSHCVRIYYKQHPENWVWLHEVSRMPPLGRFEAGKGFIPDLAVLLMFDEFIIDWQAHDRIISNTPPDWLGHWPKIIETLGAEGALSVADIEQEKKKVAGIRGAMLRRDMQNPARWAHAMRYFDNLMTTAERTLGDKVDAAGSLLWKFDPKVNPTVKGTDGQGHILSSLPLVEPGNDPNDPHYQLHKRALDHLQTQLREVNAGLAVTNSLDAAPMFWAPYKGYLETKAEEAKSLLDVNEKADAARLFFRIAFPQYRPESIREIGRLRNDKRLRQLRNEIIRASKSGDVLEPQYPQRVLDEVLKIEKRIGKVRQITGWISSAIGTIPLPGLGLASTGAAELISSRVEKYIRRDWNWFYLVSDGTGNS